MKLLSFLALCLLLVQTVSLRAGITFSAIPETVERFEPVEISATLTETPTSNPFSEARFIGNFADPSGPAQQIDGFCDSADGKVFRLRYLPTVEGEVNLTVSLNWGKYTAGTSGKFRVVQSERKGLLRVDKEHPSHFVWEGTGEHYFWNSTTTYWLLAWDEETIMESINRLAKLGINRIRVAMCGRTRDGKRWSEPSVLPTERFSFRLEPWPAANPSDIEQPNYDTTRLNPPHWQKLDRLVSLAAERGIVVSLIFYLDGADKGVDPFGKEKMGSAEEQLYYRYVLSRYAAYPNVMWDVSNEYRLFRDDTWAEKMGTLIKELDPYDHMTSIHGHGDFRFRKSPWADYAMYQQWDESGGYAFMLKNRAEQAQAGRVIPQINEEYGYEDHYPTGWGGARLWPARNGDTRRRLAWEITMAGGYQTTGERANQGTGAAEDSGGGWINGRGDETMTMLIGYKYLMEFFTKFPWWTAEPREDLVSSPGAKCLATPGKLYIAYLPKGGAASLKLAPGKYAAGWYNCRTGVSIELPEVLMEKEAVWTSPPANDVGDWAMALEAL